MAKNRSRGGRAARGEARRQERNMPLWAWLVPVLALNAQYCSKWTGFEA
jgi:hypothetical protein